MNTHAKLTPIETVYKGYRFRSRLEARWAVFFDQLGVRWVYEDQGFDLDGERYLPDFWLPDLKAFVEVKPEIREGWKIPSIYMAGRMIAPTKNETRICWRPLDIYNEHISESKTTDIWTMSRDGYEFKYCGPYTTGTGNHCDVHGDADDFMGNEGLCFSRSLSGVQAAEIVFAMFEDKEAFGTLVEMGFAHALKKRIVVGLAGPLAVKDQSDWQVEDKIVSGEVETVGREHDLWFATRTAERVFSGSREDVLNAFFSWLERSHPQPRERKLIRRLARISGSNACIVYGDPWAAFDLDYSTYPDASDGGFFEGGPDSVVEDLVRASPDWQGAARAARQARFEHGQSGAR